MEFFKIVGSGNDFVAVNNMDGQIKAGGAAAKKICDRKYGVGADGLLLAECSGRADFRMRIFNPDGSEAEMCGNGLRCILRFAEDTKMFNKNTLTVETIAGLHKGVIKGEKISVEMHVLGQPEMHLSIPVEGGRNIEGHFIDTGVPHTVIVVDNLAGVDVKNEGRQIRFHERFLPRGTNVDWIEIINTSSIKIRTYERGVENETLSCGTGSMAGALIASRLLHLASPAAVTTQSGEELRVYFDADLKKVELEGNAVVTFRGTTDLMSPKTRQSRAGGN